MSLKVAILTDKPLPQECPTGIGVRVFNLAKGLSEVGVKVHLFCRGREQTQVTYDKLIVHKIRHFTRDNVVLVTGRCKKERFNIIHTTSSYTILLNLMAKILGISTLFHYAEVWNPSLLKATQQKILLSLVDKIVCVSHNTKREVTEIFRVDKSKIEVVYNGVDVNFFKPRKTIGTFKNEFGLGGFSPIILTVGMLQKRKGQNYVIKSLPKIVKRFPNCCYVNVGGYYSHSYLTKLRRLVVELSLDRNVKFIPTLPREKLVKLINLADVCVHPALHEGFSLAVLEEMACEKPLVAFRNSSIPEIIDHLETGILVETGDTQGLASAILELLSNPELSKTLAKNARKKVEEKFTWRRAAMEFLELYKQMV